jgi:hypothetical protein
MDKRKFWPLDFDPEGEIYDNVAWDLPGYRTPRRVIAPPHEKAVRKSAVREQ